MGKLKNFLNKNISLSLILFIILVSIFNLVTIFFFRAAYSDEVHYLKETLLMSELLKKGEWIGNYGVGLHGFLFKLPVALIFILTGPSVLAATLFNFFLSMRMLFFIYK